jgi:hypothetical protein
MTLNGTGVIATDRLWRNACHNRFNIVALNAT